MRKGTPRLSKEPKPRKVREGFEPGLPGRYSGDGTGLSPQHDGGDGDADSGETEQT
jgi:hypothetical protein